MSKSSVVQKFNCLGVQLSKVQLSRIQLSKVQLSEVQLSFTYYKNRQLNLCSDVQKFNCLLPTIGKDNWTSDNWTFDNWILDNWTLRHLNFCTFELLTTELLDNWTFGHLNLSSIVEKFNCPKVQLSKIQMYKSSIV